MAVAAAAPSNALETVTLIQVNAAGNNNKFYELSKMPDGSTFARWGRIGAENAQSRTYPGHGSFRIKLDEKLRKGYTVFDGGRGSDSVPRVGGHNGQLLDQVTSGLFGPGTPRGGAAELIKYLVESNRHAIDTATGGRIRVSDSGAVTTALGPVSLAQVNQARSTLNMLRKGYDRWAVEKYLTLIPQKIANVRDTEWMTASWCRHQADLLDALESAVTMSAANDSSDTAAVAIPFRHSMDEIDCAGAEFARIAAKFNDSRNAIHAASKLNLHRVWALSDESATVWDRRKIDLKHSRELWHGTSAGNVLSILRTGLICPPTSASAYNMTGRMFGDGVYFSDQSTKSLNYAIGSAPGQFGRRGDVGNPMMFLADVLMGRECRSDATTGGSTLVTRARTGKDSKGRSYDSIFVRGGHCGVRNNEMIVWKTDQIKLTYLCEFK